MQPKDQNATSTDTPSAVIVIAAAGVVASSLKAVFESLDARVQVLDPTDDISLTSPRVVVADVENEFGLRALSMARYLESHPVLIALADSLEQQHQWRAHAHVIASREDVVQQAIELAARSLSA